MKNLTQVAADLAAIEKDIDRSRESVKGNPSGPISGNLATMLRERIEKARAALEGLAAGAPPQTAEEELASIHAAIPTLAK